VGFFSSQLLLFGPVYGHQYFFLLLAIGPFLAFPPRHRVSMWAWFGVDSPAT
jgi:hypothetical protein